MKLNLIARAYGEAFFFYVLETIGVEKCVEQIELLEKVVRDCPEMGLILKGPNISASEKFEFIDIYLKKYFSQEIIQLLQLLVENKHADLLPDIIRFIKAGTLQKEEVETVIKSAFPLDEQTVKEITKKLEAKYGKKLRVSAELDKTLIAGVQVEMGNTLIDGSLKGRLQELKDVIEYAGMY